MKTKVICIGIILSLFISSCGFFHDPVTEYSTDIDKAVEYIAEPCEVDGLDGTINSTILLDGKIYAGVYNKSISVTDGRYSVVIYDYLKGETTNIILHGKEDMAMWSFTVLNSGEFEGVFLKWDSEKQNYSAMSLCTFDSQGNFMSEKDIWEIVSTTVDELIELNSFCLDTEGNLYFYTSSYSDNLPMPQLYCYSNKDEIQLIKIFEDDVIGIQNINSEIWVSTSQRGTNSVSIVNLFDQKEVPIANFSLEISRKNVDLAIGSQESCIYIEIDDILYLYNRDTETIKQLCEYKDVFGVSDINTTGHLIISNQDEIYVLVNIDITDEGQKGYDWYRFSCSERETSKEILTIAVRQKDTILEEAVATYNRSSDLYKVVINEYDSDGNDGVSVQLQTEVVAGHIPDMMALDAINYSYMVDKGLLSDLSVFMEKDPNFSEEMFVGSTLEMYSLNDKLYAIPNVIGVNALIGKQKYLHQRKTWNLEEFRDFVDSLPDPNAATIGMSKETMLRIMMEQYISHFVNMENKTCSFEENEFIELLRYINLYPNKAVSVVDNADRIVELIQTDEIVMLPCGISDFDGYQLMKVLWGDDITYVGYPSDDGGGIVLTDLGEAYSISEQSAHKEEMWEIIKLMLTNSRVTKTGIPSYMPLFEELCEESMQKNVKLSEDGNMIEEAKLSVEIGGIDISLYALEEKDISFIKQLIEDGEPEKIVSPDIINIITEESQDYFDDIKTEQEVARIIQNRVSNYLTESL